MVRLNGDPVETAPARGTHGDWFSHLAPNGALFSIDTDQRVTRWGDTCSSLLGEADEAVGRHCYEVLASLDPRNGSRCRPNCAVLMAARRGQPLPDFEVWVPDGAGAQPAQVSVILEKDEYGDVSQVLHLVREVPARLRPEPGVEDESQGLRSMLAVLTGDQVEAEPQTPARLTARHREVLAALAVGESVDEIAERLDLSGVTVRNHIQTAMERLGAHSRLEAVLSAVARGLL